MILPGWSQGKSTQFFFGYQHTMIHQGSTANVTTVPTLAEKGLTSSGSLAPYADYGNLCNTASGNHFDGNGLCVNSSGAAVPSQQISNPFTNAIYPYNRIPSSDFDPASVNYEKAFQTYTGAEAPGKIGGTVNFFQPTEQTFNEYVARVDHQFGSNDHLFGRYYYNYYQQPGVYDSTNLSSYRSYYDTRYQNALIAETHTFSPNLLNNFVVNYQREISNRGGPPGSPSITDFGVKNIWQPPTGPFIDAVVTGYFGATSNAFAGWSRNNYTFNDDFHWIVGNHNLGFGGHFELSKFDVTNVYTSYGSFRFNPVTNSEGGFQYPNAMANFLMGFMGSFGQGNYELVNDRNHFPAVYAQDSWKVTPKLQLNYGVRWEMFAPWADRVNQQTAFSHANYLANKGTPQYALSAGKNTPGLPAGMVLSGDPGFPSQGVRNQYNKFMPRVGLAYDVFGNGKTSLRGGFGMFYQDRMQAWMNLTQSSYVPNTISVALSSLGMYSTTPGKNSGGKFSDPYCTGCSVGEYANPFPFTKPFPSTQVFPNPFQLGEYDPSGNFQVPVVYAYNLIVEQQLANNLSMRLAYVGSLSRHLWVNLEINPEVNNNLGGTDSRRVYNTAPVVGPCPATGTCNTSYSNIVMASMSGNANFNSFQATLQKRMSSGLSFLVNYTWSKTLDDMPQATRMSNTEDLNPGMSYVYPLYPADAVGIPAAARVQDIKALDRGISDIDHPQVFSASYVYAFPKLNGGNAFLRALANGWLTSGLFQHRSGDSLTTYMGNADTSKTGLNQDRAQQDLSKPAYLRGASRGVCPSGKLCYNWLNPGAFSVPVNSGPGTGFGNVVKGSLRGPGVTNWDGAVIRTFPIYRESELQFRVEYFNVVNHTQLANPNTLNPIGSSTTFGTITALATGAGPRIAQFALKYTF